MSQIRVRFAPSPTGHLHIGGVRTALFNYLYARNQGGQFLLRIEDTDRERSKKEFEAEILNGLRWLGLNWDETPVCQMDRLEIYRKALNRLLEKGAAYPDPKGTPAIYLKVPKKKVKFFDLIHDVIEFDTELFTDFVLMKSDGGPAFLFACVVDDIEMGISHVIRGDDHITNTARQLLIYEALESKPPKFAHLPLIMNEEGKPLSKREGGGALDFYIREGFLAEGLLNFLALLGWGPGGNEELFTKEELVKKFSLKRVNKTSAVLNLEKLRHINGLHLKKLSPEKYREEAGLFFERELQGKSPISQEDFLKCAVMYKDRIKTFGELSVEGKYFFEDSFDYDGEMLKKYVSTIAEKLKIYQETLKTKGDFSSTAQLESLLREEAGRCEVKPADFIHALRVILTGKTVSPGIFDVMQLLGKERVISRIEKVLKKN